MKLILEIELDRVVPFPLGSTHERNIRILQKKIVDRIDALIFDAQLNERTNSSNEALFRGLGDLKLIDFTV